MIYLKYNLIMSLSFLISCSLAQQKGCVNGKLNGSILPCCNSDNDCKDLKKCMDVPSMGGLSSGGWKACQTVEGSLCTKTCGVNLFCINGKCQSNKYKQDGENCNDGLECQSTYCNNGKCEGTKSDCRTDNICKANEECCSNGGKYRCIKWFDPSFSDYSDCRR